MALILQERKKRDPKTLTQELHDNIIKVLKKDRIPKKEWDVARKRIKNSCLTYQEITHPITQVLRT